MKLHAVARHAPAEDAPITRPRRDEDLHDLIADALRPEFDLDVIIPAVGVPIIGAAPCQVPDCVRGTYMNSLCRGHNTRWVRAGRPPREAWAHGTESAALGHRPMTGCDVPGCRRGAAEGHLCGRHAIAYRRAGRPVDRNAWLALPHTLPDASVADCALPGCGLQAEHNSRPLCRAHTLRWYGAGRPSIEDFQIDVLVCSHQSFDLRALTATMRREIQYGLQCRVDQGRIKTVPLRMRPLIIFLGRVDAVSLREHSPARWEQLLTASTSVGFTKGPMSFIRFTLDSLEDLQHGVGWDSEYPRDVWRLRRLGYQDATLAHLRFDTIDPPWLRDLAKRWLRWRLSTGLSITQAGKDVLGLRRFAAFLADTHTACPTPAALDRELIERYLAWLALTRPIAKGRSGEIGSLAGLLRATQQHRWLDDVPATAVVFAEDYPRQPEAPSRALSGYVMSQLESEANLARFAETRFRLLTELLQRAGLRVGDARRLKITCLRRDEHGAAYLAYRNHKMRRDAVVPIDDALAAAISIQQQAVRYRWPDAPVLFPMIYANPDGTRPISRAAYAAQLNRWLAECDVRDESGALVTVTPHQFRHTYATALINLDVPQHVVKKLLDHDSDTMTAHYARLNQQTVRRHWEAARKVSISGEITIETVGPLADAVWLKNSLSRAKMALPNGYCTLPLQQTCEYANACLTCPMFLTTAEFLPQHRQQLTETRVLLNHAERHDQQRLLQMNRTVERNLLTIINTLERPGCCSQADGTTGCGCRSEGGGADAG